MFLEKARALWTAASGETGGDAGPGITGDVGAGGEGEGATEAEATPDSKLFRCPECDVVYLALEKETCSSCRAEVTEVAGSPTDG